MKLIERSFWTSIVPRPNTVGDNTIGLPYFTQPPKAIEFCLPDRDFLYYYRQPPAELVLLLKEQTHQTGLADINYNYAIASNVEGAFVLRGAMTKCSNSENLKCLVLLGNNEKPTDLLKKNQADFLEHFQDYISHTGPNKPPVGNAIPKPILRPGDYNVHVFGLMEYLYELGYLRTRNSGLYDDILKHAVAELQLDQGLKEYHGTYDEWLHRSLKNNPQRLKNNQRLVYA